jgi:hypothetical protein
MKLKSALLAVLGGSAAIAAPAFAHDGYYGGWHHGYHAYPRHYVPAPVYYRPAPRVVYVPAPAYYRPAPVYSAPVVVAPGFSIRFNLPL